MRRRKYNYSKSRRKLDMRIVVITIGIAFIALAGFLFVGYQKQYKTLNTKGVYSKEEINMLIFNFLYDFGKELDHETDVVKIIHDADNRREILSIINKMEKRGYNADSIANIYDSTKLDKFKAISKEKYNETLDKYAVISYFDFDKLDQYIAYGEINQSIEVKDVVLHVNLGINRPHYEGAVLIDNYDDFDVLVNKYLALPSNFVPKDLVKVSSQYAYGEQYLRKEAYDAFIALSNEIKAQGMKGILISSAYRSIDEQQQVYDRFVKNNGQAYADAYAARAGHSEHHLGLTTDIVATYNPYTKEFHNTPEYEYVKNNSYKFGFVLHYTPEKELITGYSAESWHIRYVGVELATFLFENNLTLDEYYAMGYKK